MISGIEAVAAWVLRASALGAVLITAVLLLRIVLGRRVAAGWWCAIWIIVGLRLVLPGIPSRISIFNLAGLWSSSAAVARAPQPAAASGSRILKVMIEGAPQIAPAGTVLAKQLNPKPIRWGPILSLLWLAGVAIMIGRGALSEYWLARRIGKMNPLDNPKVIALLRQCAHQMRVSPPSHVVETDQLRSPAVWGMWRPVLLLPPAIAQCPPTDLRLILLHELAHLRRCDVLVDRILGIVRAIHWFNPFAWLWLALYRADRELACDEAVLRVVEPPQRSSYGQCLLRVVEQVSGLAPASATVGMFGSKSNLQRRITMISSFGDARKRGWWTAGMLVFVLLGCAALSDARKPDTIPAQRVETPSAAPAPAEVPADAEAKKALAKPLPEVHFDAVALSDVIDYLRDVSGTNIFVNWKALEASGVDKNVPVSTRLRNISLEKCLKAVLSDAGGGTVKLGFTVDEGVITISTDEDLSKNVITRVYDIRDLLTEPADYAPPGQRQLPTTQKSTREDRVTDVTQLIEETVAADSWRDSGGSIGSIRELSGQLVITQTSANHKEIEKLLALVRETRSVQISIETRFLTIDATTLKQLGLLGDELAEAEPKLISAESVASLLKAVKDGQNASLLTAPRLTLFNGQHAHAVIGNSTPYISGFTVVKKEGETRYEAQNSAVETGTMLDVTATASADRKGVTLHVEPKLITLAMLQPSKWEGVSGVNDLMVQKPLLDVQEALTTVNVADGQTVLVPLTHTHEPVINVQELKGTLNVPESRKYVEITMPNPPPLASRTIMLVKATLILQREANAELRAAKALEYLAR